MTRAAGLRLLAAAAVLASATGAFAQTLNSEPRGTAPEHVSAPFFAELEHPGSRTAQRLLAQALWLRAAADEHVVGAWSTACRRVVTVASPVDHDETRRGGMRTLRLLAERAMIRKARIEGALLRLTRARRLSPDDPDVLYHLAEALSQWEEPGPLFQCQARRRSDEAIEVYAALTATHPNYRPALIATELALLHTREREFAAAAHAYRRALSLSLGEQNAPVLHNNLAEVTMLAGDLEGALSHYERALDQASDGRDRALSLWGLSVALDRLGEHEAALLRAREALQTEGGRMRMLRSPGVFFEPARELHYYEALGHEAQAELTPEARGEHLEAAADSLRAYLADAPASDPFRPNAEANLARLSDAAAQRDARRSTTADTLP